MRWVYATLIDSALAAHDLILGTLTAEDREQHYTESQLFAGMFGISRASLPNDYREFTAYIAAMLNSDILTVGASARMIAERIFAGSGTAFGAPSSYRALTSAMLPERLRRDFGPTYGEPECRKADHIVKWTRRMYPLLPDRVRYVAPYHEGQERVAGKAAPTALTRLLNRVWVGQPSLAG